VSLINNHVRTIRALGSFAPAPCDKPLPSDPIHEQNGMSAGLDGKGDLLEVQRHGLGVAGR
jgi:hypothetical protein